MVKTVRDAFLYVLGFFVTIMMPPLFISGITYALFPRLEITFVQLLWLVIIGWLSLNYITINIEKAIKDNKKGE